MRCMSFYIILGYHIVILSNNTYTNFENALIESTRTT